MTSNMNMINNMQYEIPNMMGNIQRAVVTNPNSVSITFGPNGHAQSYNFVSNNQVFTTTRYFDNFVFIFLSLGK